jgi:glycosyltransferase involved in cell wall biosynthesis
LSRVVTVVLPAYGEAAGLVRLLTQLDRQSVGDDPLPVVVADDASPQPLAEALAGRTFARLALDIVRSEDNRGPGGARNLALRHVRTPWVAFLDTDMTPGEGWLARLESWAARSDGPDGVEGLVRAEGGTPPTPFTHATEMEQFGSHHGAGNVAFRTDVLRTAGGFDERFYDSWRRVHFREDTELYFRLEELGFDVAEDPGWVAYHPPLEKSFWSPVRLARRYAFDPLLSREHPERFRAFVARRRVGGVPLRWARHQAAVLHAAGGLALAAGLLSRRTGLSVAGGTLYAASLAATAKAISWKRNVGLRLLPPLVAVSALVPWVYLWSYYRGVVRFRHRPRLR